MIYWTWNLIRVSMTNKQTHATQIASYVMYHTEDHHARCKHIVIFCEQTDSEQILPSQKLFIQSMNIKS